jgi:hypothetical protein
MNLVARVNNEGTNFDMDVTEFLKEFREKGPAFVKRRLEEDGDLVVFFIREEEEGEWSML